jgi:hypothetical protein
LGLLIGVCSGKPADTMKSLSGSLKLLIFAALGTGVIVGARALADCTFTPKPGYKVFKVSKERAVKNEDAFSDIFDNLGKDAQYCFHIRHSPGHKGHGKYKDKTEYDITNVSNGSSQFDIKTDKVTVSDKKASNEELTRISSHTTVQIASPSSSDITAVQNALSP